MGRIFNVIVAASLVMWGGIATTPAAAGELYGLIGKINTIPGQRDAFIELLLQGVNDMPGCLNYVVAKDMVDPNAIWVTEVWDSKASHDASLSLPAVREAISKGRAFIASMGDGAVTIPVGGFGLPAAAR
ncbi:MAG: antibiotic biosynthesis monooxygenase [Rhodospirillaceae bacterium]|nr:antibiotic biosynthesis monooxygenase [Rhodospirillaceae bacterium]